MELDLSVIPVCDHPSEAVKCDGGGEPCGNNRNSETPNAIIDMIVDIRLLDHSGDLTWERNPSEQRINLPDGIPCNHAYAFRILFEAGGSL